MSGMRTTPELNLVRNVTAHWSVSTSLYHADAVSMLSYQTSTCAHMPGRSLALSLLNLHSISTRSNLDLYIIVSKCLPLNVSAQKFIRIPEYTLIITAWVLWHLTWFRLECCFYAESCTITTACQGQSSLQQYSRSFLIKTCNFVVHKLLFLFGKSWVNVMCGLVFLWQPWQVACWFYTYITYWYNDKIAILPFIWYACFEVFDFHTLSTPGQDLNHVTVTLLSHSYNLSRVK